MKEDIQKRSCWIH